VTLSIEHFSVRTFERELLASSGGTTRPKGITHVLELAQAAGIPVAKVLFIEPPSNKSDPDATARLVELLMQTAPWQEFAAMKPGGFRLHPAAMVEVSMAAARAEQRLLRFAPGVEAFQDLAERILSVSRELCAPQLALDFDAGVTFSLSLATSAWLHLGAEVFVVSLRPGRPPVASSAAIEGNELRFGRKSTNAVEELAVKLGELWPFAFDAHFVNYHERIQLVDATVSNGAAEENTRGLGAALPVSGWGPGLEGMLANCSPRPHSEPNVVLETIARGQAQGDRWASGPLATSLESAAHLVALGEKPILVLDRLLPSQAGALKGLVGLALRHDGPASHITILARSSGLAVLPRLKTQLTSWPADGEQVTISEAHRTLCQGAELPRPTPTSAIAPALSIGVINPVALTMVGSKTGEPMRSPVGLCRSEMQILRAPEAAEFTAYLGRIAESGREEAPPYAVAARLEQSLEELLSANAGELLNYRLLDADLDEVLAGTAAEVRGTQATSRATLRGPRWALGCGFYAWQVEMAIRVAARCSSKTPVDLVITVPSAFDVSELRAIRKLFDQAVAQNSGSGQRIRFGAMIETPRLCAQAALLNEVAEVFCFGLNDLTSSTFGLGREAWDALAGYYQMAGLLAEDPFSILDSRAVAPLVQDTINVLRRAGAKGPIFLCGEPANSPTAHALAIRHPDTFVSVDQSDWAAATVSCAREYARLTFGPALEVDAGAEATCRMTARTAAAARAGRFALAADLALEWFLAHCPLADDNLTRNWKVLKKWLVSAVFGDLAGRFIMPGWSADDVASYARSLLAGPQTIRISEFPSGISCHARSEVFDPDWTDLRLLEFVRTFDRSCTLHIFPQQDAEQTCFRAVYTDGSVLVEAGWGQAMYVFETERGYHPVALARAETGGSFLLEQTDDVPARIVDGLRTFLNAQCDWLRSVGQVLSRLLGAEQFAIEGYFDPRLPDRVVVVDIDLPLDIAWNTSR
jgi:hypothetical protein